MVKALTVVGLLMLYSGISFAAKGQRRALSSYLVDTRSAYDLRVSQDLYSVEGRVGSQVVMIVPADRREEFLEQFPGAKLQEVNIYDVFARKDREMPGWRIGYHNFDTIQSELNSLVQKYPNLASLENYGNSEEGRPLLALRMTSPTKANKAEVMITSSTHGNEIATPEVTMSMINEILRKYGNDARFTTMLDKHVLYFIPVLSPDGYVYQSREISGLDPNRDYPWPSDPNHQSVGTIQNEMKWFATKHIVGSVDIHANYRAVMYPWAYTDQPVSDSNDLQRFETICSQMGQDTGFQYGPIYSTIYPAPGSSADYWYWKYKTIALGFEMGGEDFAPPSSELPQLINEVVPSLYRFIESF